MESTNPFEQKYKKHLENVKNAVHKYNEKNRDLINAKARNYYNEKLANNMEYKDKKKQYNRERYLRKKNTEL